MADAVSFAVAKTAEIASNPANLDLDTVRAVAASAVPDRDVTDEQLHAVRDRTLFGMVAMLMGATAIANREGRQVVTGADIWAAARHLNVHPRAGAGAGAGADTDTPVGSDDDSAVL